MLKQIHLGVWEDVSSTNKLNFWYNGNKSSQALNNPALKRGRHLSAPSILFFWMLLPAWHVFISIKKKKKKKEIALMEPRKHKFLDNLQLSKLVLLLLYT